MINLSGRLVWNNEGLASALKISPEDVGEYYTDGRCISIIRERRIAVELVKGKLAKSEGAAYDPMNPEGWK